MRYTLALAACIGSTLTAGAAGLPLIASELYNPTNVWTVHLRFTADEWKALEPKRAEGAGGFGPMADLGGRDSMLQGAPGKRNGLSSSMMGLEFGYVHADLELGGITFTNVGVRYKGNGTYMESQGGNKRPLKADLNKFVKGQKLAGHTTLDFQNNTTDAGMMNDTLAYRLFRDAGVPAPRTTYAKVYVDAPGAHTNTYFGLYTMPENVDAAFAKDRFGVKGGLILKPVTSKLFSDLGDDWSKYETPYDPKTKPVELQKKRLIEFAKFVSHADDADYAKRLSDFIDLDGFARYLAVNVWLANFDSILDMGQNFYLYLDPRSNKFTFIPWDLDHSFGTFGMKGSQEEREQLSIMHPWTGTNRFLERTFALGDFSKRYRAELERINTTLAKPERLQAQVDEVGAAIRDAVAEEGADKRQRFEQSVAGQNPTAGGAGGNSRGPGNRGGGGGFGFPASKPIKAFVVARSASVTDQLAGKSKGREVQDRMFGGGPGGPRGQRGPGGPGGPEGFGPGNFLAEPLLSLADSDKDGKVTPAEFHALGAKWFTAWDADKKGEIQQAQITKGLNTAFPPPPGMDGPPGGGPGGGGFGPGNFIGPALLVALDENKDKTVTQAEFLGAFDRWAKSWDKDQKGFLNEDKLREGINRDWTGPRMGFGGPPGDGPRPN
jgi:spore coat protein H